MTELELLWMLAEHLALTALPGALGAFVAMRRGLRSVPLLLCVALAASGLTAILAFWAFYADPTVGQAFAFLRRARLCLRNRALPPRPARPGPAERARRAGGAVGAGAVHSSSTSASSTAARRTADAWRRRASHTRCHPTTRSPTIFADWFFHHGHDGSPPLFGDWLSSDRPPLQIGYVLAQRPFGWDESGLHYEVLGVIVQQLWILGMWAVLSRRPPAAPGPRPGDRRRDRQRRHDRQRLLRLAEADRGGVPAGGAGDGPLRGLAASAPQPQGGGSLRRPLRPGDARARRERLRHPAAARLRRAAR